VKLLLLLTLLIGSLFADFYIVNGDKKVKMSSLSTGKIDFSTFNTIATIERGNSELHAMGDEVALNHRYLNFRLVTIGLNQVNYTITEWSEKAKESENSYYINFDNYTREDGVMLQLFYQNNWYAVILGDPLKIAQEMFSKLDINAKDFELDKAIVAIKQARTAFPLDDILKRVEIELENKCANESKNSAKNPAPNDKPVKVFFN
jgi:hypothetical protein